MINYKVLNLNEDELRMYNRTESEELLLSVQRGDFGHAESIGWLDPDEWADEDALVKLEEKAREVRKKADIFIVIGVGGSNRSAKAMIQALSTTGPEILFSGDTLSNYEMERTLSKIQNKSVYINVIAKNFETLEPGVSFRILRSYLERIYGKEEAAKRIITTGTKGSSLHKMALEHDFTFLTFPDNIGGRYSALCDVGLFPMAVAGIAIKRLVLGAKAMKELLFQMPAKENMALKYVCTRNLLAQRGFYVEALSYFEPRLCCFSDWWVQLFAESEGKESRGIFPTACKFTEDLHAVGQFIQEGTPIIFETFLLVENEESHLLIPESVIPDEFEYLLGKSMHELNKVAEYATIQSHSKRLPCICISIDKIDEYHLGGLFYFFAFSCYLSCLLLDIDPFDQPGVEAYKEVMFEKLLKPKQRRSYS